MISFFPITLTPRRSGDDSSFGVSAMSGLSSRENRMELIRQLSLRLDRTTIEHLDWQRCVDLYDRPATFFFVDPPYTGGDAKNYEAWTDADILALRQKLGRLKGRWLLTLNDSPPIRSIFHDCRLTALARPRGISNKGGKAVVYKELIIEPK